MYVVERRIITAYTNETQQGNKMRPLILSLIAVMLLSLTYIFPAEAAYDTGYTQTTEYKKKKTRCCKKRKTTHCHKKPNTKTRCH